MKSIDSVEDEIKNLCQDISLFQRGALDSFWKLYPILLEYNFSEKVQNTCNFIRSSEDWISPQDCRQYCSKEFIEKMDKAERKLLDYYKDDINMFVQDVLRELGNMGKESI